MISKYRNRAALLIGCAAGVTAIIVYVLWHSYGHNMDERLAAAMVFVYLGNWALWTYGSYALAKAKGYSGDTAGGILMFLALLAFCLPGAVLLYPWEIVFGLKDKARHRRSRH